MQNNEVKSKRSILVAVALMLLIAASVIVLGKMSAAQRGVSQTVPADSSRTSVSVLTSSEVPNGTTKYFSVCCRVSSNNPSEEVLTKYLKVVKTGITGNEENNLTVYEANSLNAALSASTPSSSLTGLWTSDNGQETWTVSLSPDGGYSEIFSPNLSLSALQSWKSVVASGLPEGMANYYRISCKTNNGEVVTKYLKVVKDFDGTLKVYEGDTSASFSDMASSMFTAMYEVQMQGSIPYEETWYLALAADSNDFAYRTILTLSPLDTIINASKIWNGREDGANYVDVAKDTTVQFALYQNGIEQIVFYVRKRIDAGTSCLQVSLDRQEYSDHQVIYNDSKTISAMLKEANNSDFTLTPEEWLITITGYDREDASGSLIEYTVKELDVDSSQPWICSDDTNMVHTFNGAEIQENAVIEYTLMMRGNVQGSVNPNVTNSEFNVLKICKKISSGKVTDITVEGLQNKIDTGSEDSIFATVIGAASNEKTMDAWYGKVTFDGNSAITLSDIIDHGVDVKFNIGANNGTVTLNLRLTESGKLSYNFKGLPADIFTVDPDGREIAVDSYRVVTTKATDN